MLIFLVVVPTYGLFLTSSRALTATIKVSPAFFAFCSVVTLKYFSKSTGLTAYVPYKLNTPNLIFFPSKENSLPLYPSLSPIAVFDLSVKVNVASSMDCASTAT